MTKARLGTVLSVTIMVLAVVAAVFNTLNNGRVTWKGVGGLVFFACMALGVRTVLAGSDRSSAVAKEKATK